MSNKSPVIKTILLANQPRLFRQMLHRVLASVSSFALIVEVDNLADIAQVCQQVQADWLIVSFTDEGDIPQAADDILLHNSATSLLALSPDGHIEIQPAGDDNEERYSFYDLPLIDLLLLLRENSFALLQRVQRDFAM